MLYILPKLPFSKESDASPADINLPWYDFKGLKTQYLFTLKLWRCIFLFHELSNT